MKSFKILGITWALSGLTLFSPAQTLQDVNGVKSKGVEMMGAGDLNGAITEFEKCVELAKKVGSDADEQRLIAENALPNLYLRKAGKIQDSKDYPAALEAYNAAVAAAVKYNNKDVKNKAEKAVPQIYYEVGNSAYEAKQYSEAIKNLDMAIEHEPGMAGAYYIKGVCYQALKNEPEMMDNYKLAIEKGDANSDVTTVKKAKTQITKYFYNIGMAAQALHNWDDAIGAYNKVVAADSTYSNAYYVLASCYNSKKSWDTAIANCEKALKLRAGAESKMLDPIYYELGTAYAGKKNNGKACDCFKKVENEPFLGGAKYHIETALKCK